MLSVYKTPPFDGEILLEFDINTLQQLKNKYFFSRKETKCCENLLSQHDIVDCANYEV